MIWSYAEAIKNGCFFCDTHEFSGQAVKVEIKVFNGRPRNYEREYILCDKCARKFNRRMNAIKEITKE